MITGVSPKGFILALFIREDGERFLLGDGGYVFKESQLMFEANNMVNDLVELQGRDGVKIVGQVRRAGIQSFDGYVGDGSSTKTEIETMRRAFINFFQKDFRYTVVYVFCDGKAVQRRRGYIVDAPEAKELYQIHPEYHIALSFEDVNYYTYDENTSGEEIPANIVDVPLSTSQTGGLVWDNIGAVVVASTEADLGFEWEVGVGGITTLVNNSLETAWPIWVVSGETQNPEITNLTTGNTLTFIGTVGAGQTLVVDMANQTASLDGVNVVGSMSGDWLPLARGENTIYYTASNADAPASLVEWQEIVG